MFDEGVKRQGAATLKPIKKPIEVKAPAAGKPPHYFYVVSSGRYSIGYDTLAYINNVEASYSSLHHFLAAPLGPTLLPWPKCQILSDHRVSSARLE